MMDLTLSEFLDFINCLQLKSIMYYYFALYVFTNLASRALDFKVQPGTLDLGHKFIFTLILISAFHVILSIRQSIIPVQDFHTSLMEVAIFFIILLYVIGRWLISTNGLLQYFVTKSLLQNKKTTEKALAEDYRKQVSDLEKNKEEFEKSHPEVNFTELLANQKKSINYDLVKTTAAERAAEIRDHWVFLFTDSYIFIFILYNSTIQNIFTNTALFGILAVFIYPRIKVVYNLYKAERKYEIPIKNG